LFSDGSFGDVPSPYQRRGQWEERGQRKGGVTERPETMCPGTNVLGPLVPKLIVPCDIMSLDLYIPVIMHYAICLGWCEMTGMYKCKDIFVLGTIHLGDQGSQKIHTGTNCFGTSRHPTRREGKRLEDTWSERQWKEEKKEPEPRPPPHPPPKLLRNSPRVKSANC